ncbi:MAG TPA: CHAT domain-containing protein [Cyclobacteriaceae bacterium]|nr:CHAT domain-containing protein [Cyclobacteriaceae bacterium]
MKRHHYTTLLLLFVINCFVSAQSKWDKTLAKTEAIYVTGAYKSAGSSLAKFKKKVDAKLGGQNPYTPTILLMQAKIALHSGLPLEFETNAQSALGSSKSINGETNDKYANMVIDVADLYNQNGSFRIAREYLNEARKILEGANLFKDPIKAKWDLVMGETLSGQGYFNEAIALFSSRQEYFARRAIKQETIPDGKGGLKSRKIPDEEVAQRFGDYARLMTSLGTTYGNQGNLRAADSAFVFAAGWIKKNLDDHSHTLEYIRNQLNNAKVLVENGNETLPKDLEYDRTLLILKSFFAPSHYLGIQLYEEYLKELMRTDNTARYSNTKSEYEKMIDKEFPKNSIYQARLKAVEFDSRLNRDKTKKLDIMALDVINQTGTLPHNNILTAEILDFLAELAIHQKKYTDAEKYLVDIVSIKTDLFGAEAPETHLSKLTLANFYLDYTNKITEAGKIYEESYVKIAGKEIGSWHKDHLDILNHLAIYYELTDQYKKAVTTLDKAGLVARAKYRDTDYTYAEELTRIAKLELKLGQYEDAEKNINKSLSILEEFKKDESKKGLLIEAIDAQANLFGIKGLFDEAEDALDRTAKIISKADGPLGIDENTSAQDLASLFIMLGRYSETDELLTSLIAEYEKTYGKESLRLIEPLVNRGKLLLAEGDYTGADKIALRANQIAVAVYGEKSSKVAPTQKLLADIDYTIGDYEKAEDNIVKALTSQEKQFGRNHIDVAKSLSQYALIKFYKGDKRNEVEKIMVEARDIMGAKLGKDNPQYADILKNTAVLYISEKKYDQAFSSLTQAEAIWRNKTGRKNSIQAASIFALTGDVYYQLKNYVKAEEFYRKGKDLYEKYFSDKHPEYVKILSKLAKVYYMQKDFKGAKKNIELALNNYESFIKQYFPALSEREKAKYWNTIKGDFEFYNTLAFGQLEDFRDLSGKVYNYQLLTKALLLSSSIKIRERIQNSTDENLKASYNTWVQKKEFLTNALSMSSQQLLDNAIDPVALGNEVEKLERELSEKSEIFGQSFENKRITYENVQSALGKNEVAVEMVRYRHFNHSFTDSIIYVALYVKGDKSRPKVIELPDGHRMETRFFRYYRNCIIGKLPDQNSYRVFWEPFQKEIGTYSTIFISPDGVYNQINLESIPTPDGKYVIDNSNIVMVSNTKDLYLRTVKQKLAGNQGKVINNASMFGNPTFYLTASSNPKIPDLPGTEKEVNALQQLLKGKGWTTDEYMENTASEEKVKALDNPRIFHIATHGFYTKAEDESAAKQLTENEAMMAENPLMKSGLLLKGAGDILDKTSYNYNIESGVLTAYEAMSLNLDKTDLVVLSACETGLGEISNGEGVYGLQRAFFVAGAKVLIMSMFKVDDDATQKLILNFYRKWLASGNLRKSFIEAKQELRAEYPEPIFWGAFMMIGLD